MSRLEDRIPLRYLHEPWAQRLPKEGKYQHLDSTINANARLLDNGRLFASHLWDNATVREWAVASDSGAHGNSVIAGMGQLLDGSHMFDDAYLGDLAYITGASTVRGSTRITGTARVADGSKVKNAIVHSSKVGGNSTVSGTSCVINNSKIKGSSEVDGTTQVHENSGVYESKLKGRSVAMNGTIRQSTLQDSIVWNARTKDVTGDKCLICCNATMKGREVVGVQGKVICGEEDVEDLDSPKVREEYKKTHRQLDPLIEAWLADWESLGPESHRVMSHAVQVNSSINGNQHNNMGALGMQINSSLNGKQYNNMSGSGVQQNDSLNGTQYNDMSGPGTQSNYSRNGNQHSFSNGSGIQFNHCHDGNQFFVYEGKRVQINDLSGTRSRSRNILTGNGSQFNNYGTGRVFNGNFTGAVTFGAPGTGFTFTQSDNPQ